MGSFAAFDPLEPAIPTGVLSGRRRRTSHRHYRRPACRPQCRGACRGAGACRRQQHGHRRDYLDHRLGAGAQSGTGDAADQLHGRGNVVRYAAGRHAVEGLRPALCPAGRLRFRSAVRTDLMCGSSARFILAIACRHAVRRPLCGRAPVVSFCCGRYGDTAVSRQSRRVGACWRRVCCGARAADRHFHQRYLADLFVRSNLPRPIGVCGTRCGRTFVPQHSAPARVAFARRRPPAGHDHCAAEVHRRGGMRPCELHHDEHDDDLGAAGNGHVQSHRQRGRARHPVARAGHVCAEFHHRLADRALWRAADDGDRACADRRCGLHRTFRHRAVEFLDRTDNSRRRLEFRLHRRHHLGDRVPRSARAQQGSGVQRFPGVRLNGYWFVLVRRAAGAFRLDGGE